MTEKIWNIYHMCKNRITAGAKGILRFLRGSSSEKDLEHLSHASLIEEAESKTRYTVMIWVILAMIILFFAWASLTSIKTRVNVTGQVKTNQPIQKIQHYEGGILEKILVIQGDIVQEGTPLVQLRSGTTASELEKLQSRYFYQLATLARLRALVNNTEPDFPLASSESERKTINDQKLLLATQKESLKQQKNILVAKINQRKAEYIQLQRKMAGQKQQLITVKEELSIQKKLWDKRLLARTTYLDTKQDVEELQTSIQETEASLARAGEALQESEQALIELDARSKNQSLDEIGTLASEKIQTESSLNAITERANRLIVRAPTTGQIKNITIATIGATVRNGQDIMEILPIDDQLFVEVRVKPQDIADISIGDETLVKVSAFEFTEHGQIKGKIRYISPDTFLDEVDQQPFYYAHVELEQQYVGENQRNMILPGMLVQADIIAGEQTILRYLFKPIIRAVDRLFTER